MPFVNHFYDSRSVFSINIALVILGIVIPIGTVFFWSRLAKILDTRFENNSQGSILKVTTGYNFVKWLYYHRSKFNIIMAALVTIIEFLALMPF